MIGAAQVSIARVVTDAQPSTCVGFLYKPLDGVRSATNPGPSTSSARPAEHGARGRYQHIVILVLNEGPRHDPNDNNMW